MNDDLGIGAGPEDVVFPQVPAKLAVVIDLSIDCDYQRAVLVPERLGAALNVDDGEAPEHEREEPVIVELLVVGTSVLELGRHALEDGEPLRQAALRPGESQGAGEAAHASYAVRPCADRRDCATRSLHGFDHRLEKGRRWSSSAPRRPPGRRCSFEQLPPAMSRPTRKSRPRQASGRALPGGSGQHDLGVGLDVSDRPC